MTPLSYSIAIRTLGTSGAKFRRELESIAAQDVQPEKVVIYIAEGYPRPEFTVGREEYVWVKKGMVAQRALRYDEISSDCILLLDDDVELAPDSAERLLKAMDDNAADCVGADVFLNHLMPAGARIYAAVTNLVFPHRSSRWAFKVHRNGSFSYNRKPKKSFYPSQSCGGPAMMWKKDSLLNLGLQDELWLDGLGFAFGDDLLETYKLHCNGGFLGVLYGSGIRNLDARSSSDGLRRGSSHILIRTKAFFMIWWRSIYRNGKDTPASRLLAAAAFSLKMLWMVPVMSGASLIKWDGKYISGFFKGLGSGWREVHSTGFRNLPKYVK